MTRHHVESQTTNIICLALFHNHRVAGSIRMPTRKSHLSETAYVHQAYVFKYPVDIYRRFLVDCKPRCVVLNTKSKFVMEQWFLACFVRCVKNHWNSRCREDVDAIKSTIGSVLWTDIAVSCFLADPYIDVARNEESDFPDLQTQSRTSTSQSLRHLVCHKWKRNH